MKVISVVNNKGGVGKTTTSRMLAEYFSIVKQEKILLIDFDPQANLSNRYLSMDVDPYCEEGLMPPVHPLFSSEILDNQKWDGRCSIAGIFFGEEIALYETYIDNLQIIPSHSSKLLLAEMVRAKEVVEKVYDQLVAFLQWPTVKDAAYDKVIIDTPPSKGPLTIGAIRASTDLIIPSIMEPQPIEGIYGMVHLWKNETIRRSDNTTPNLIGVVPVSYVANSKLHQCNYNNVLEQMPDFVFKTKIGRRLAHPEFDTPEAKGTSIFELQQPSKAKKEVIAFCEEFEKRMNSYVTY